MEIWVLGQPLYQWLGDDFVQRNTLVAGVALGFALIPLIFRWRKMPCSAYRLV